MAAKTIAITRPKGEKDALTGLLHARGHHVVHEPLTHIVFRHDAQDAIERALDNNPDAVLVTSRQGVKALAACTGLRDTVMLCVGPATARAAETFGFTRIYTAGGDVRRLIEYTLTAYDPGSSLLYIAAEHTRVNLGVLLSRQGMHIEHIVAYEAVATEKFSDIFTEHLKRGQIDAVTFLSHRAAEIFSHCVSEEKLTKSLRLMRAFVLSRAIAEALTERHWGRVHIAAVPTLVSLTAAIDRAFKKQAKK